MLSATSFCAPALTAVTATREATPITTPSAVSIARNQLARSAASAIRQCSTRRRHRHGASELVRLVRDDARPRAAGSVRRAAPTSFEWVTITSVLPSALTCSSRASTSSALAESRFPVGSSSSRTLGRDDERAGDRDALLLAAGELVRPVAGPVREADGGERLEHALPSLARGEARVDERQLDVLGGGRAGQQIVGLEDESDPQRRAPAPGATRERCVTSSSRSRYEPVVGRSRQPRIPSSVVLPEPDSPMIATNSPSSTAKLTPRSACTSTSPARWDFVTSSSSRTLTPRRPAGATRVHPPSGRFGSPRSCCRPGRAGRCGPTPRRQS